MTAPDAANSAAPVPWPAAAIAATGVLPTAALAIGVWIAPGLKDALTQAAVVYGGVLLGFLGGVRWGAELTRAPAAPSLGRIAAGGLATAPGTAIALLGASHPILALGLLGVAGLGHLAWDVAAARSGLLPAWTAKVRVALTLLSLIGLGAIAARA